MHIPQTKFASSVLTLFVIGLLITATPTRAAELILTNPAAAVQGSNPLFDLTLNLETSHLPATTVTFVVEGPQNATCVFHTNGTPISGCDDFTITATIAAPYGYGYGYGYGYSTGALTWNIQWDTAAYPVGSYTTRYHVDSLTSATTTITLTRQNSVTTRRSGGGGGGSVYTPPTKQPETKAPAQESRAITLNDEDVGNVIEANAPPTQPASQTSERAASITGFVTGSSDETTPWARFIIAGTILAVAVTGLTLGVRQKVRERQLKKLQEEWERIRPPEQP